MLHCFHYALAWLEIMCIALIPLLLKNMKLFFTHYILYIKLFADSSMFKCLIAIRCLESQMETLQWKNCPPPLPFFFFLSYDDNRHIHRSIAKKVIFNFRGPQNVKIRQNLHLKNLSIYNIFCAKYEQGKVKMAEICTDNFML